MDADEHGVCAMADISWAETAISTISTPTLAAGPPGGGGADVDTATAAAATIATAAATAAPSSATAAKCLAYGGLAASVAAAAIREGWHAAATGTEEPSAAAVAMGGRYKHRAMLAPLEIPDAGGDASSSFSPIASLLSARACSGLLSAVSSEREDHTPASAKRQRTPCGWAEAATPPPPTHCSVSATATGTEEPGATAPTFALAASPAAAASVAADAANSPTPLESPQEGAGLLGEASAATAGLFAAMAPSPVSQLQLSYFTDLFVKDGTAAVATDAASAADARPAWCRRARRCQCRCAWRRRRPSSRRRSCRAPPSRGAPRATRSMRPWSADARRGCGRDSPSPESLACGV